MSNIEFNDGLTPSPSDKGSIRYSRFEKSEDRPNMVNFLIKKRLVNSEDSANTILLIISMIFFLSGILLIYFYFF